MKGIVVLLVENYESNAKLLMTILRNIEGVALVRVARSRREAIEIISQYADIDLILLDWNLGDGNGEDVIRQAREQNKQIQCVVMSGYNYDDKFAAMFGADGYIDKKDLDRLGEILPRYFPRQ